MYKDTITLYNRYNGTWHGVVLTGVDLNADRGAIVAKYGSDSKDNAKLHLKINDGKIGAYTYLLPLNYKGQNGTVTLSSGNNFTFFIEGDTGIYTAQDSAFVDGFYDWANQTYDHCYAVTSVARYSVIPHFEVLAR